VAIYEIARGDSSRPRFRCGSSSTSASLGGQFYGAFLRRFCVFAVAAAGSKRKQGATGARYFPECYPRSWTDRYRGRDTLARWRYDSAGKRHASMRLCPVRVYFVRSVTIYLKLQQLHEINSRGFPKGGTGLRARGTSPKCQRRSAYVGYIARIVHPRALLRPAVSIAILSRRNERRSAGRKWRWRNKVPRCRAPALLKHERPSRHPPPRKCSRGRANSRDTPCK